MAAEAVKEEFPRARCVAVAVERDRNVGTDEAAGAGAKTTGAGGRGRGARGGVIAHRADGRTPADGLGAPPGVKPQSRAGGAVPAAAAVRRRVRVEVRPEGGKIFRGAGLPGGDGTDAARSVVTAESSPCKVLVGGGAHWATIIGAVGLLQNPGCPRRVRPKPERKWFWRRVKKPSSQDGGRRGQRKQIH